MFKVGNKFSVGDRVKFKKSSLDSGMIDATEDDVFVVLSDHLAANSAFIKTTHDPLEWYTIKHFEHAEEEIMNNVDAVADHYVPKVGDRVKGFAFESGTGVSPVPEDNTAIDWEIGQEVFCLIFGKGKVDYIGKDKDISVAFEKDAGIRWYTSDGKYFEDANRTLFFSEPKIEAEKFPPKKPFVPVFKQGETVVAKKKDGKNTVVFYVDKETEISVESTGCGYPKTLYNFYKISEEVKFS